MGFFGKVALSSALGGLADDMKENRQYAKDKSERVQDYLYQRGLERRQEVNKTRNALQNSVEYLQSKDMDSRSLNALLMQNPKEVLRLAQAAQEAEQEGRLTKSILNQAVDVASDFDDQGLTASELIKRATPDFVSGAALKKPEEVERNAMQKLFGRKSSQDILYDVYSESLFGDKTTGADVAASISAPTIKGRKEGPNDVSVDLGALAENESYDSTYKINAANDIKDNYDRFLTEETKRIADEIEAEEDQTVKDILLAQQAELTRINNIENAATRYYELMKSNPSIVENIMVPGYLVVLSDPDYFKDGTADLFTSSDEDE
jgi:hypothetical protein